MTLELKNNIMGNLMPFWDILPDLLVLRVCDMNEATNVLLNICKIMVWTLCPYHIHCVWAKVAVKRWHPSRISLSCRRQPRD